MREQRRWPISPWIPALTGTLWLWASSQAGFWSFLLALPVAAPMLAAGLGLALWPGDRRLAQILALSSVLGVLWVLPMIFLLGLGPALLMGALSAAGFLVAGRSATYQEPSTEGVPAPAPSLGLDAQVALDEAILGMEQLLVAMPVGNEATRVVGEVREARAFFEAEGFLAEPARYHQAPPPAADVQIRRTHARGIALETMRFESGYAPREGEPGRERWQGYDSLRTVHAYLLRHRDAQARGWLVCTNGFRMGSAAIDTRVFQRFHKQLGLNVLIPVLPLHGPRRIGRQSGDGYLAGEVMDTVHALAQGMWDVRRMIGWLLATQGAARIGAYGLSLGGYNTALLACVADGLDAAIAGIPATDIAAIFWRHGPPLQLGYLSHIGVDEEQVRSVCRVVSPLVLHPKVPKEGRMIFGGVADRLVVPAQVQALYRHWDEPRMVWYQGGHCTFGLDPRVQEGVAATLREAKLLG